MQSFHDLPADLPVPVDDGAADHLPGAAVPSVRLASTAGDEVDLAQAAAKIVVLYVYPRTGVPGEPLPEGWDEIPGARGCTPQNCAFRDLEGELRALGATVHGLSAQPLAEQHEFAARERIPYPLLNDSALELQTELNLPTFDVAGMRLYKRLTLIARSYRHAGGNRSDAARERRRPALGAERANDVGRHGRPRRKASRRGGPEQAGGDGWQLLRRGRGAGAGRPRKSEPRRRPRPSLGCRIRRRVLRRVVLYPDGRPSDYRALPSLCSPASGRRSPYARIAPARRDRAS